MTRKPKEFTIHPPLCPPPTDMNWELLTPPSGWQFYLCWPLGKSLREASLPLLERLLAATKGQEKQDPTR